jgi:hypothetical protein
VKQNKNQPNNKKKERRKKERNVNRLDGLSGGS